MARRSPFLLWRYWQSRRPKLAVVCAVGLCVLALSGFAQGPPEGARFGAVSIKVLAPGQAPFGAPVGAVRPGGKYVDEHASLWSLIVFAFPNFYFPNKTIVGLPSWAYGDTSFDVQAVPGLGRSPDLTEMQAMMSAALSDRFGLRFHVETRRMPVFFLQVEKGGIKNIVPSPQGQQSLLLVIRGSAIFGRGASMDELAGKVGAYYEDRPVLNRTGMNGFYDVDGPTPTGLEANRESRKSMILRELGLLGLRLVPGNAEVPVMVVDHVAMPAPN